MGSFETALALDCFVKKNKASICTQYLPNEADVDNSSKDEEIDEDAMLPKASNLLLQTTSAKSEALSKKSSSEDSQKDCSLGLIKQKEYEMPVFGSQLKEERLKFMDGIDLEACAYPKTIKISKYLESKNFNFWTEGLALLDRVLHEQTESLERELIHVSSMTFNK